MNLPSNFQFSQGSLQDFVDCPRRFQLKYIEKLAWPALEVEPALENENYLQQGAAFHRLIQQYLVGVPVKKLTEIAAQDGLSRWWENFLDSRESLEGLQDNPDTSCYPEVSVSTTLNNFRLAGKFDLLFVSKKKCTIYDWKTSRKQPKREWIASNLQTRVYPFLLVEAGSVFCKDKHILPSQIEMVYWFANFPTAPLTFFYNDAKYQEDRNFIEALVDAIKEIGDLPAPMTENDRRCRYCVYRSLCNRGIEAGPLDELDNNKVQDAVDFELDFEQIAEIEF